MKTISHNVQSSSLNSGQVQPSGKRLSVHQVVKSATEIEFRAVMSRIAVIKANWSKEEKALRRRIGEARRRQLFNLVSCKSTWVAEV